MLTKDYDKSNFDLPRSSSSAAHSSTHLVDARTRFIHGALELFIRNGVEGTSARAIAKHVGLNVALINYHFGSRDGLIKACFAQIGFEKLKQVQDLLQMPRSKEEFEVRFKIFIRHLFDCYAQQPELTLFIHREIERLSEPAEEVFSQTFKRAFEIFVQYVKDAQTLNFIRQDVRAQTAASIAFGSALHAVRSDTLASRYFGVSLKDPQYRESFAEHLTTIFLQGAQP